MASWRMGSLLPSHDQIEGPSVLYYARNTWHLLTVINIVINHYTTLELIWLWSAKVYFDVCRRQNIKKNIPTDAHLIRLDAHKALIWEISSITFELVRIQWKFLVQQMVQGLRISYERIKLTSTNEIVTSFANDPLVFRFLHVDVLHRVHIWSCLSL